MRLKLSAVAREASSKHGMARWWRYESNELLIYFLLRSKATFFVQSPAVSASMIGIQTHILLVLKEV